jgi:hypothetical protein
MSVRKELTPEQVAKLENYHKEWFKIGTCTDPADRPRAEAAITELYKMAKLDKPEFLWVNSPNHAKEYLDPSHTYSACWYGQQEVTWIAFYVFAEKELGVVYPEERSRQLHLWAEIAKSCHWWWPFSKVCIISERPAVMTWDTNTRINIHNEKGPAIKYRDDWAIWAIHGVRVPQEVVESPKDIPATKVMEEMIDRMGYEILVMEINAKVINEDKLGKLLRIEIENDEAIQIVEVLNKTPEITGEHKRYFLRVPPTMTTAAEAVAWTFDVEPKEYRPSKET